MLPDLVRPREGDLVVSSGDIVEDLLPVMLRTHAFSLSDARGDAVADTMPFFRPNEEVPLVVLVAIPDVDLPSDALRFSEALPVAVVLVLLRGGVGEELLAEAGSEAPVWNRRSLASNWLPLTPPPFSFSLAD